jgi:hypothetical protein
MKRNSPIHLLNGQAPALCCFSCDVQVLLVLPVLLVT